MPCDRMRAGASSMLPSPVSSQDLGAGAPAAIERRPIDRTGRRRMPVAGEPQAVARRSGCRRRSRSGTCGRRRARRSGRGSGRRCRWPCDRDRAADALVAVADAAHQRRLAGAVRADEADEFAGARPRGRCPPARSGCRSDLREAADSHQRLSALGASATCAAASRPSTAASELADRSASRSSRPRPRRARPCEAIRQTMMMTTKVAPTISFHRNGRSPDRLALR